MIVLFNPLLEMELVTSSYPYASPRSVHSGDGIGGGDSGDGGDDGAPGGVGACSACQQMHCHADEQLPRLLAENRKRVVPMSVHDGGYCDVAGRI